MNQTAEAKKNLLIFRTENPNCKAYFAFPCNFKGEANAYTLAGHSIPKKLFSVVDEEYVLIGGALWNKIGNYDVTYKELENFSLNIYIALLINCIIK